MRDFFEKSGNLLSTEYNPDEVYVQTTDRDRTIDSALAQMEGLYGKSLLWPSVDPDFSINTIPTAEDYLLHVDANNCKRFAELDNDVLNDAATKAMLA